MTDRKRIAALAGALALTLSSCGAGGRPSAGPSPALDPRIRGTIVSDNADGERAGVRFQPLPSGDTAEVEIPESVRFIALGAPVDDETMAVLGFGDRGATLFRVDRAGFRPLVRSLTDANSLSVGGGLVAVGDCSADRLLVVPAAGGTARRLGGSCVATLSPDGRQVAWIEGGTVYRSPVTGAGAPTRWFSLADVPKLDTIVVPRDRRPFELVWGPPGLVLVVGNDQNTAVIVKPTEGRLRAVDTLGSSFMSFVQWQPGGHLLAMANGQTGGEGYVRLYDPEDDSIRTIGLHPRGFISAAWAPDGQSLVTVTGSGLFGAGSPGYRLFIDVQGRQFGRVRGRGAFVIGWLP